MILAYFRSHILAMSLAYNQVKEKISSFGLIIGLIGLSWFVPLVIGTLVHNIQQFSSKWDSGVRILLTLPRDVSQQHIDKVLVDLNKRTDVLDINYISAQQGLELYQQQLEFDNLAELFDDNPLPAVIEVQPKSLQLTNSKMQILATELKNISKASSYQLNLNWWQQIVLWVDFLQNGIYFFFAISLVVVVLITAHAIGLVIRNYSNEINIFATVGASSAFIRRPFLYIGALYGIGGAMFAWLGLGTFIWWLNGSLQDIYQFYSFSTAFTMPDLMLMLSFCGLMLILGLLGSILAVARNVTIS